MHKLIQLSLFIFTLILCSDLFGQIIWEENFDVAGKGFWADSVGNIYSDLTNIDWELDISACTFSDENDYAKTVLSGGGRFEVLDSDGEIIWISEIINTSSNKVFSISLEANEIGNGAADDKKYIKAFYQINGQDPISFRPESEALGDWGSTTLVQEGISGTSLRIIIKMNSSYASDKVFIDNIRVEAFDSSLIVPSYIKLIESPLFAFTHDTIVLSAATLNKSNELVNDSSIQLNLESNSLTIVNYKFQEGYYIWKVISDSIGEIQYIINDDQNKLAPITKSIIILLEDNAVIKESFENNTSPNWNLQSDWKISDDSPISGSYSIKHIEKDEGGMSALIYNSNTLSLNTADYFFSFQLKNGDWDPSSSNSFYFWLTCIGDHEYPDGYVVGVNAEGSTDKISLWKMQNGQADILLAETSFDWDANQKIQFNVERKVNGEWLLNITNLDSGESYSCSAFDIEFISIADLQLIFNYTTTRSGKLWFDNLLVCTQDTPPFIYKVKATDRNEFKITFNEAINLELFSETNLIVQGENGRQYTIYEITITDNKNVVIKTENIDELYLKIIANTIYDLTGLVTLQCELDFENILLAEPFDIIITELMVDPNPPVGLPEAEYIEIYNRSNKNIQLHNWKLFVRDQDFELPVEIIEAGECIILCDDKYASDFLEYGTILPIEKFPALLNSGSTIRLKSDSNLLIDEIKYSIEWYHDNQKDNGGYSIERIDYNRFCGQQNNWAASIDLSGGTPGKINSISAPNIDTKGPEIIAVDILSTTSIGVIFNEGVDSISALNALSYTISNNSITDVEFSLSEKKLIISLNKTLISNTEYQLDISEIFDNCGNITTDISTTFVLTDLHKGDVLINEVLFNPFLGGSDFIELYNNSGVTIDLNDLMLATRDDSLKLKSIYNISENHILFPNESFFAFSKDTVYILDTYYTPSPNNLIPMTDFPPFNNDKGRVVLLNDSFNVIDEFIYNENMQSDWLNELDGVSLERISINQETNLSTNWHSASSLVGYATPGYKNSQANIDEPQKNSIVFESDIVSPNGDGYNDELTITLFVDQPGYLSNVYIFNANGNLIKQISNNELLGIKSKITYDLTNKNGALIPLGTYLILTELIHPLSKRIILKKAFHVTDKLN